MGWVAAHACAAAARQGKGTVDCFGPGVRRSSPAAPTAKAAAQRDLAGHQPSHLLA